MAPPAFGVLNIIWEMGVANTHNPTKAGMVTIFVIRSAVPIR